MKILKLIKKEIQAWIWLFRGRCYHCGGTTYAWGDRDYCNDCKERV